MLAAGSESEIRAAVQALAEIDGAGGNPVCASQIALMNRTADAFAAAASETVSSSALSGRLRCCHAAGMTQLIGCLRGFCG